MENPSATGSTLESETTLDQIDGIAVPGNPFIRPTNEYWALTYLAQGLEFLYRQVQNCDGLARSRLNPSGDLTITAYGNDPASSGMPLGLLTCAFQWYAVDACKYVWTVGAIDHQREPAKHPRPRAYVQRVIPEVLAFRDKVAAHFAGTTRNSKDSPAERLLSILPQLSFVDDALCVAALTVAVSTGGVGSDSTVVERWSIQDIHRRLAERYWPSRPPLRA